MLAACTLESCGSCSATSRPTFDLDLLYGMASMVDKSLLQQIEQPTGESRFAMLETIREYACEKLTASSEEALTKRAHAAYCLVLAEEESADQNNAGAESCRTPGGTRAGAR